MRKFNATPLHLPNGTGFKTSGQPFSALTRSGSIVLIEASGEIVLDKEFEVEAGACFEISVIN